MQRASGKRNTKVAFIFAGTAIAVAANAEMRINIINRLSEGFSTAIC